MSWFTLLVLVGYVLLDPIPLRYWVPGVPIVRPDEFVGRIGRASTEVGASGRVEIDGQQIEALTMGPPIPAGEQVEVTGWRLVDGSRPVLSVSVVRQPPPAPPRSLVRVSDPDPAGEPLGRPEWSEWDWGQLLLTFCQIVSVLGCCSAVLYAMFVFVASPLSAIGAVAGGLYGAGMFVVFTRAKQLPRKQ